MKKIDRYNLKIDVGTVRYGTVQPKNLSLKLQRATETLYTVEPSLPWLKDLSGLAAP